MIKGLGIFRHLSSMPPAQIMQGGAKLLSIFKESFEGKILHRLNIVFLGA